MSDNTKTTLNSVISGDLTMSGVVELGGQVNGDVDIDGVCHLKGIVKGNLKAQNLIMYQGALISGHKTIVRNNMRMKYGSEVRGCIYCGNVEIHGIVKGEVFAKGAALIGEDGIVDGNLTACCIAAEDGCIITGRTDLMYPVEV